MRYLKHWFWVILWAGLIFLLSSIPHLESGLKEDFILRKMAHVFEYFVLTMLLFNAFSGHYLHIKQKHPPHWLALIFAFSLSLIYAASDEWHQTFVLFRSGTVRDVFIDAIGILMAIFLLYWRRVFK